MNIWVMAGEPLTVSASKLKVFKKIKQ